MFSLILFVLLTAIGYWFFTKNFDYWKKRGISGPKPLPFFGNVLDLFLNSRTDLELNYYRKYGNFYGYFLGNKPVLVVGEPELIKQILVKDFNIFPQRRGPDTSHPVMKHNLANIQGNDWKRVRSILSPSFTSSKMMKMYPLMEDCLTDFMAPLDDLAKTKSNVNLKDIYGNLTLDVIASAAFATKLNLRNEEDSLFIKHARLMTRINPIKLLLLKIIPNTVFKILGVSLDRGSVADSQDFYVNVVRQIIENRRKSGQKPVDLLQILLDADQSVRDDDTDNTESHHVNEGMEELEAAKKVLNVKFNSSNKKLSEDEVIAHAVSVLAGGYETTATTLTCASYELALNPDIQDKLCAEINASLNAQGRIDYYVLSRLPYLDAVVSETLRRHAPPYKTNRIASQEYKVGDTGITVYAGQQVDIPIHAIHHDEKYYTDPFKFDPDRFMPHNRENLVPYTYLPFGAGIRNCIGMRFSLLETKLALAQMVRRYTFFRCAETDVPLISEPKALLSVPKRVIVGIALR